MNQKQAPDVGELNQSIIGHITNALNSFCFGECKEETDYPVALTKVEIESSGIKTEYDLSIRLHKNSKGILQNSSVRVRNIGD